MKLIATGKWSKEKKNWNMVVALPERLAAPSHGERKAPKRAPVVSLLSRSKKHPA